MRSFWFAFLFLLSIIASPDAAAQSSVSGGFSRVVNQYRWTSDIAVREQRANWGVEFLNQFRSDAFILFDNRLSFRDEDRFYMALRRPFRSTELVIYGQGGWYSLSDVVSTSAYTGVRLGTGRRFWVEPLIGVSLDRRPGIAEDLGEDPLRTDTGPAAGFNLGLPTSTYDGYEVRLSGQGRFEMFSPRRGDLLRLFGVVRKSYNQLDTRTLFKLSSVRRDAYQAASFLNRGDAASTIAETVESTRSDTLDLGLTLNQTVSSVLSIGGQIDVGLNRRHVRILSAPESALIFDTDFSRDDLRAEINAQYAKRDLFLRLSVSTGAQVEQRTLVNADDLPPAQAAQKILLLRQADFDRGVVEARLISRVPMGKRIQVQTDLTANIVRHDTPEVNPDDRDELYYSGQVGATMRLTNAIELQLQLFGTYFHTVYLKSTRSVENNVQRSLRLRPTVRWRPRPGTKIELVSQVRATYTVDDFLLPGRRSADQSARELRYDLDAEHALDESISLKFTGRVSDLRLGRFLQDAFAEIPFDSLLTTNLWGRIQVGSRITAELGYRSLVRSDYDRALNVDYAVAGSSQGPDGDVSVPRSLSIVRPGRRTISQTGPTASIQVPMRRMSYLRLDGWVIIQRITHRLYGPLPAEDADRIRQAAADGTRTLIPNLTVSMQWIF